MPGSPSESRSRRTAGVITPRSSAISGSGAERLPRRVEHRAPRPAPPASGERVARAGRHRPVGRRTRGSGRSARGRRARTSAPAARSTSGTRAAAAPASRTADCPRAGPCPCRRPAACRPPRRRGTARDARDGRRTGRDVDRHVADQPHAALVRVRPQRAPLALEPHLVGDRAATGEARPVLDPARLALAEVELLVLAHRRVRLGQQPRPGGERRARLVWRAVAIRRAERQHLPPRLAGLHQPVDPRVRVAPEPPARSDVGGAGRPTSAASPRRGSVREPRRDVCARPLPDTSAEMPPPPPPRIQIQYPEPAVDAGRYPAKRTVGDLVEVRADVFRDGHDKLRAVAVYRADGERKWREAELHPLDADINGVRWGGSFVVDRARPLGVLDRGLDRRLRDLARRAAAQARSRPARPLGRAERGRRAPAGRGRAGEGRRPQADRPRAPRARPTPRSSRPPSTTRRSGPSSTRRRAQRRAPRRHAARAAADARGRPRPRALRLLVRGVPALVGRDRGRRGAAAQARRARLRRALHDADPSDRAHEPQGPQQRAHRRPRRSRVAVRGRGRRRRSRRGRPQLGTVEDVRRSARPRRSTAWTSRWTSRSTPRPTTRG